MTAGTYKLPTPCGSGVYKYWNYLTVSNSFRNMPHLRTAGVIDKCSPECRGVLEVCTCGATKLYAVYVGIISC